jgi:hypothetical protein
LNGENIAGGGLNNKEMHLINVEEIGNHVSIKILSISTKKIRSLQKEEMEEESEGDHKEETEETDQKPKLFA